MSMEQEVRAASAAFYDALNAMGRGATGTMADAWWHGAHVTAMHPIGARITGWDGVRASFDQVAAVATSASLALVDQQIHVVGDLAYELGIESGSLKIGGHDVDIQQRVTNLYRREDGVWKMVHHHSDASPAMEDILRRLQG